MVIPVLSTGRCFIALKIGLQSSDLFGGASHDDELPPLRERFVVTQGVGIVIKNRANTSKVCYSDPDDDLSPTLPLKSGGLLLGLS